MQAGRRVGEHLAALHRHAERVLELRRQRSVARHRRPAVAEDLHVRAAQVDHRLDREEHAGAQRHALAATAVVQDVGLVVEQPAEPVAAEVAHHRAALALGVGLDGGADVAGRRTLAHDGDAAHHRLVRHLHEALGATRHLADEVHARRVPVPAVDDEGDVDVDDVAVLQRLAIGQAVADDVVEGGANRFAVAPVVERGGIGAVRHREVEHQPVEVVGQRAWMDVRGQHVEGGGGELAGAAHAGEGVGAVQLDLARLAARRFLRVDEGHGGVPAPREG